MLILSNKYFQPKSSLLNCFHLGVWEISNSTWLKSTIFWYSRKENLSLLPLCPLLFAIKWGDWMPGSSVQSLSSAWLFATPCSAAYQTSLSITNSQNLPKRMSIESVMPSNHLIPCCPLLLQSSIFPSIRAISNESVLHIRWPQYWSFSFSMSPLIEYSGLISFRIHWLDLLGVQRTLKSLLQHYSSKASILWWSTFFMVQLSHLYMTTGKTIVLTRWTFFGKVMSLFLNMLSRLVIAFLSRNKCLIISWL